MTDLDSNHRARRLEVRRRDEAERARRRRRSHWSYTAPVNTTGAPRPASPAVDPPPWSGTELSTSGRTMIEELAAVRRGLGLSTAELWWRYFALGGMISPLELEAALDDALAPAARECDLLAVALNERALELGEGRRILFCTGVVDA